MSKRREGREAAVQYLYQLDIHGEPDAVQREEFWKLREGSDKVRVFADALVQGVLQHQAELDERIRKYAQNFALERLNVVDRNILRLAIFEMFHNLEVPPVVAINEAIEIAKRLGGQDSSKFVNGILDKVKAELTRPLRDAVVPYTKNKR